MTSLCIITLARQMWWLMHSVGSHGGALASVASREWRMLETVGQFGLQYREQDQGTLGSLVATPSLLSRVIKSQGLSL